MSNKKQVKQPYLVIEVIDGRLGAVKSRDTLAEAVKLVADMAQNAGDPRGIARIKNEVIDDLNWASNQGDHWIHIAQAEHKSYGEK